MDTEEIDHYADWEWQPLDRMPDGCNDVTIRYEDGSTRDMCSCDYWWSLRDPQMNVATQFRFT